MSRGGLTAVQYDCLPIFLTAEQLFRKNTSGNPHKVDVADMVDLLTTKPDVISIFNNIFEEFGVKMFFARIEN